MYKFKVNDIVVYKKRKYTVAFRNIYKYISKLPFYHIFPLSKRDSNRWVSENDIELYERKYQVFPVVAWLEEHYTKV